MELSDFREMLSSFMSDGRLDSGEVNSLKCWLNTKDLDWQALAALRNAAVEYFVAKMANAEASIPRQQATEAVLGLGKVVSTLWKHGIAEHVTANGQETRPFFGPHDDLGQVIVSELKKARKSVHIAVYTITYDPLADTLCRIHDDFNKYGKPLEIRIITEDSTIDEPGSDVKRLCQCSGIQVRTDNCRSLMHHKFAVIDGKTLLNGSFNWTRTARYHNFENLTVTGDATLVKMFLNEFRSIWSQCRPLHVPLHSP